MNTILLAAVLAAPVPAAPRSLEHCDMQGEWVCHFGTACYRAWSGFFTLGPNGEYACQSDPDAPGSVGNFYVGAWSVSGNTLIIKERRLDFPESDYVTYRFSMNHTTHSSGQIRGSMVDSEGRELWSFVILSRK
jgi:hypothetical protein